MRAGIVLTAFLPFLFYAAKDTVFHFKGRKVTFAEHILHLVIGVALVIVLTHAILGHSGVMLVGLLFFVVAGGIDEYVWHRGIPEVESDLHAKEHLALLIFVVTTLVVNWLEAHQWQIPWESFRAPTTAHPPGAELPANGAISGLSEPPWWRTVVFPVFLIPYAWFGLSDNIHHARHRHVGWTEKILHLTIVMALFTVVPQLISGQWSITLIGLVLFLVARSWDEWGYHRNLGARETEMHARTHLAFLIFIVLSVTVDWVAQQNGFLTSEP